MNEIINYVMNTPGNTNPNVLKGLLDKAGGSGDGGSQEPLVINLLPSDVEDITKGGTYTGATPSEVREHLLSGGQVVAKFYGLCFQLTGAVFDKNNGNASGLHVEDQGGAGIVLVINVHCGPHDSATYELHTYALNPMQ